MERGKKIGWSLIGGGMLSIASSLPIFCYEAGQEPRRTFYEYAERPAIKAYIDAKKDLEDTYAEFRQYEFVSDMPSSTSEPSIEDIEKLLVDFRKEFEEMEQKISNFKEASESPEVKGFIEFQESLPTPYLPIATLLGGFLVSCIGVVVKEFSGFKKRPSEKPTASAV